MNKLFKTYIPGISMAFTFVVVYAAIYNIAHKESKDGFLYFILELVVYLILSVVVDFFVEKINFKKYISHFLLETSILYPITLIIAFWGNWFRITVPNVIWYSCVYVFIMGAVHYYFYFVSKKQAEQINEILYSKQSRKEQ